MKITTHSALRRSTLLFAAFACCGLASVQAASFSNGNRTDLDTYADRANFSAVTEDVLYTRYIVTYAEGSAESSLSSARQADFQRVAMETGLRVSGVRTLATGAQLVEVRGDKQRFSSYAQSAREVMVSFARNSEVAYVEPDRIMRPTLTPNDNYFANQWDLTNPTGGIGMPSAWDMATGAGVKVAVLDTGITTHSDLSGQIVGGYDFISSSATARDGNGRDSNPADEGDWNAANECGSGVPKSDSSWHGTHVTGTIVAKTNNAAGIAGIAYGAKVVPVRVLGKCGGSVSDIVDAIVWSSGGSVSGVPANANPAKVLNLSLGGGGACGSFQAAINTARANGATFVVAAGNENQNVSNSSPANCSGVVSVASTTKTGARSSFSNYGSTIVISAPGGDGSGGAGDILSTLNAGATTPAGETYAYYAGTSMATPHVAALVALIYQLKPSVTPDQVKTYLTQNARPLPGACSGGCGAGIIDAPATLQAVAGGGGNPPAGGVLQNGVAATGLAAPAGGTVSYTMQVPAGSSNLVFQMSGGTGDGDMYVRFGSAPGTAAGTYDCRPYLSGNNESCTFASPQAGTWYVTIRAYSAFSGVSLKGSYSTGGGGNPPAGGVLQNGVAATGLAAPAGGTVSYTMQVPAGSSNLVFQMSGGTGDGDMYVRFGSAPGTAAGTYDCRPYLSGNNESCTFASPQAGTWYVTIRAYSAFSGVSLKGSYSTGGGGNPPAGNVLQNGVPVTGLSATTGNWSQTYTLVVPAGAKNLSIQTSGGSGDADLYVRIGAAPTSGTYTCRPWLSGNAETCSWANPTAGTYYVRLNAYSSFSGVTLKASFTP